MTLDEYGVMSCVAHPKLGQAMQLLFPGELGFKRERIRSVDSGTGLVRQMELGFLVTQPLKATKSLRIGEC